MKLLSRTLSVLSLVIITVLGSAIGAVPVYADEAPSARIQISPASLELNLKPGTTTTDKFTITNTGNVEFSYELSVAPYSVVNEEYNSDLVSETNYTDLSGWVTFSKDGGKLKPEDQDEITFTVTVPKDVPAGGQYAAILAKIADSSDVEGTGVSIVQQVGMLLYSSVAGNTRKSGSVLENKVPSFLFKPPVTATALVENTGNVHAEAEYILQVFPLFSDEEVFTNEEHPLSVMVLPETKRFNSVTWDGAPQLGIFKVKQTVKFLNDTSVTEKIVFLCPIWFLVIITLIVAFVIFWIITRVRGRRDY